MLKFAVCDDEKEVREYLSSRIYDLLADADLDGRVALFPDGESLCALYESGKADFDLLFLDITMPGADGLTVAKRIREVDKSVMLVFVTMAPSFPT